jgi:plasmid stability protein
MAKLIDDPKVAELVSKEVAKAIKAHHKAVTAKVKEILTQHQTTHKEAGAKAELAAVKAAQVETLAELKALAEKASE